MHFLLTTSLQYPATHTRHMRSMVPEPVQKVSPALQFDSVLHFRKDFYKATPIGKTAIELDPDSKAAAELRAAYAEAKRLSGYANKPLSEVA